MIETITLNEAMRILRCKDVRTLESWCDNNGVKIQYSSKRKRYIFLTQFEYARSRNFIQDLKFRFPNNWIEAYKSYSRKDFVHLMELEKTIAFRTPPRVIGTTTSGRNSKIFLSRLTNKFSELT